MTVLTERPGRQPKPEFEPEKKTKGMLAVFFLVVTVPLLALVAAVPVAWGWGLTWTDVAIAVGFYVFCGLGVTVGFHRYFTHGSFKANRPLKLLLGIAGSMSLEMSVIDWVATHRKHHKYSDKEGDPHSPWRFGTSFRAVCKGLLYAHMGWMFEADRVNRSRYAPDLLKDPDALRLHRWFPAIATASVLLPPVIGGLITWSWQGALTAFFWGSLVRIGLLHHVTWSINSICHVFGKRQFASRDESGNVWWLALPSFGESWHNLHHAYPVSARHGVLKGQIDLSAGLIRAFEKLGWAYDVHWPDPARVAAKRIA
ncbi:acyl-CoA desaturase [Thermobispora bispora]|jgi:stearoyl-CoA desaturase (Delta-9 desaturase)|uniref:Stearoyl-CoA 9-desaturase n=1 Tax=Thermobispora bispora (strain ATCC 19993 / DSM 43833 / CBS 139.67 / JCM 10125 / KCTC 9307 / NBRC 14880 / R51) TaxID=469371 RepID=D6Y8B4_THEBD|nr:acyl-CoA desaturase [Thermobispora bispora]ADG89850.1 Stearoyl-CoA 9-desaturase [Thermobispora bispora DSM 43833]MBO2473978.1 acyl-CoA desaturase [Actinomycetales bacterium]QSI49430.1 acyl-CoA desaturase [Thermobispora bispora]